MGEASFGRVNAADGSTEDASPLCCSLCRVDKVKQGGAWPGEVVQGRVRYGMLIVADSSTELRKRLPAALYGEWLRFGRTWTGKLKCDKVRRGNCCRRQHWGLQAPLLLSFGSRYGGACLSQVRQSKVRRGKVTVADGSTEGLCSPCCSLEE